MKSGTWGTSETFRRAREKNDADFPLWPDSKIIRRGRKLKTKKKKAPAAAGAFSD
jgi:hypothetical protein